MLLFRFALDLKPKKSKRNPALPSHIPAPSPDVQALAGIDGILQQCIRYFQQLTALAQIEELNTCKFNFHLPRHLLILRSRQTSSYVRCKRIRKDSHRKAHRADSRV